MATPTAPAAALDPVPVPPGYCQCRCGGRTNIARETNRRRGVIAGQPMRFIHGHRARLPQARQRGPRPGAIERVWAAVRFVDGPLATPCWIPPGAPTWPNGYGRVRITGRTEYAHRLAYEEFIGPIPDGAQVDHHCDVRECLRPEHLFIGSHTINARDGASKGRLHRKLRPGNVLEMRDLHRHGWSLNALAAKFGVSPTTVRRITMTRSTWRHLTPPDWEPSMKQAVREVA